VSRHEEQRLEQDAKREHYWKRWGPYLAERQWGTVREDYSADGNCWDYFPHDQARSRAYRWGEDGLMGISDRQGRLCFALALWNERDPILKERLFGLTGPQGNHGEDVKECYYYLDATPTSSYLKSLYKYPHAAFPYEQLVAENARRGKTDPEFELADTGVFDNQRYFDVAVEYAKGAPEDVLVRITVQNRGPEAATLHLLPTLWFRNSWAWGREGERYAAKPCIAAHQQGSVITSHPSLGRHVLTAEPSAGRAPPMWLFTENETNAVRLFGSENKSAYSKDAFHEFVVNSNTAAVNPARIGTKAAPHYIVTVAAEGEATIRLRLRAHEDAAMAEPFGAEFDETFTARIAEADAFYAARIPESLHTEERRVARQAYAGLLWSKQFYYYDVKEWVSGDPGQPTPPAARQRGRNAEWGHLHNADVISMPDVWEYPWYAAWDLAFHTLPLARVDATFAKEQLLLLMREWYMHPNGQLPAYEFAFGDVNPPVHAWAVWRVYKVTAKRGERDLLFLERAFHKLLLNFTWWVNRKDPDGRNLFGGGFLGLDNIGVFDRSRPLPTGGHLEQADGTAWMAFYCATMLSMALELARHMPAYDDVASKFFEHFVAIADAINTLGGTGLWHEEDGFYYDVLHHETGDLPLRVRSMVGIIPLLACEIIEEGTVEALPGFQRRLKWFLENRPDLAEFTSYFEARTNDGHTHRRRLLAIPTRERLQRVLQYVLDESEFLSPYGIRSVSAVHREQPYVLRFGGEEFKVAYDPGESTTDLFGGNSNWRGPIWFPLNYLLIEALEKYDHFYGDRLQVEYPVGSGTMCRLGIVAHDLSRRLSELFLPDAHGRRPVHGDDPRYASDEAWKDLVLFYEYFNGDCGRGIGASHQTGWTALVTRCLERVGAARVANERRDDTRPDHAEHDHSASHAPAASEESEA